MELYTLHAESMRVDGTNDDEAAGLGLFLVFVGIF